MYIPEPALEYETHKFLRDFKIQTDHLISTRWPDLIIINKKDNFQNCGLYFPADLRFKLKEFKKKHKYLELARKLKKKTLRNMKVTMIPNIIGALSTVTRGLVQGLYDL